MHSIITIIIKKAEYYDTWLTERLLFMCAKTKLPIVSFARGWGVFGNQPVFWLSRTRAPGHPCRTHSWLRPILLWRIQLIYFWYSTICVLKVENNTFLLLDSLWFCHWTDCLNTFFSSLRYSPNNFESSPIPFDCLLKSPTVLSPLHCLQCRHISLRN